MSTQKLFHTIVGRSKSPIKNIAIYCWIIKSRDQTNIRRNKSITPQKNPSQHQR